jgi:hypothetical protein
MTDPRQLMKVETRFRPLLLEGDDRVLGPAVIGWAESGLTVRVVRGRKMRTLEGLYNEFAAALQFPLYFGKNRDAFYECVAELANLPPGEGYVVTITEPDQVLVDSGVEALGWLAGSLASAAEGWRQTVELGEWWDRPAVPFHVVLGGEADVIVTATQRWSRAGVIPVPFGQI